MFVLAVVFKAIETVLALISTGLYGTPFGDTSIGDTIMKYTGLTVYFWFIFIVMLAIILDMNWDFISDAIFSFLVALVVLVGAAILLDQLGGSSGGSKGTKMTRSAGALGIIAALLLVADGIYVLVINLK